MLTSASATRGDPVANYYAHLIGGAGHGLDPATCVYLDDIEPDGSLESLVGFVEQVFASEGCKPKIVVLGTKGESKSPSRTLKWVRAALDDSSESFRETYETLQFFPKGRTTVEDAWYPAVYFGVSIGAGPKAAFFCANRLIDEAGVLDRIHGMNRIVHSCAAYGFYFPKKFSPLGHFWGIEVQPGRRREGAYATRESRRLSHWRDNTQIGILSGGTRRFYKVCDGYVRDAYPLILMSAKHMDRRIGRMTLAEAIEQRGVGQVSAEGDQFLWDIPAAKLAEAQTLLDENDISLSGRRLT